MPATSSGIATTAHESTVGLFTDGLLQVPGMGIPILQNISKATFNGLHTHVPKLLKLFSDAQTAWSFASCLKKTQTDPKYLPRGFKTSTMTTWPKPY